MFKSIKFKLILLNLVLTGMVLIFIFLGIFVSLKTQMYAENTALINSVGMNESLSPNNHPPDKPENSFIKNPKKNRFEGTPLFLNCFFIKLDDNNNLLAISDNFKNQIDDIEDINELISLTFADANKENSKIILHNQNRLQYEIFNKPYGKLIVFLDTHSTQSVLYRLIIISLFIGILSLALVFAISFYWTSKALIPLKESWERQKSFTGDASHELRSPLSVMQSNIDILMDNSDMTAEEQRPWLENIDYEIKNMTTLTNTLLSLARFDEENSKLDMCEFKISNIIDYIENSFSTLCKEKNLNFSVNTNDVNLVYGNEFEIRRLIIILIDNAIKYTPENGSIYLSISSKNKFIEIKISDTGIGMSHEEINHIFDRFYRVDKVRERSIGGFGLGLSIANMIVKSHNGKIIVKSEIDKGSTFIINLPKK